MPENAAEVGTPNVYDLRNLLAAPILSRPVFRKEVLTGLDEYFGLERDYYEWLKVHPNTSTEIDVMTYINLRDAPLHFLERRPDIERLLEALQSGDIKLVLRAGGASESQPSPQGRDRDSVNARAGYPPR